MELFKYNSPDTFSSGEAINGYDTVAWTECYREPGSFELTGKLSSGLREFLPEGTLISHTKTLEIMMVENIQVKENTDIDPDVTITGRSIQAILEQRITGQNWDWAAPPSSLEVAQYVLSSNYPWVQSRTLINDHIGPGALNVEDQIPQLIAAHNMTGTSVAEPRTLARGEVLKHLLELLAIADLGCRVLRKHAFPGFPRTGSHTTTYLEIHDGDDKRQTVVFSTKNGDIDTAEYLWSIKKMKNSALVTGKFVEMMVEGTEAGFNRRVMQVDGSDIDGHLEAIPIGTDLTTIQAKMLVRGNQALASQKRLALSRIDISSTPTYRFRKDYNIGDLVSVDNNYGTIDTMRVVEHVEIVDETGESSHPTLEIIES